MMWEETDRRMRGQQTSLQSARTSETCLAELIDVLRANPSGLRRWSVMRAMRSRAEKAGREITPKFEDDVERVFRRHCAGDSMRAGTAAGSENELFHRPKDKAGEVWALNTHFATDK
jgi:hypothetical protein